MPISSLIPVSGTVRPVLRPRTPGSKYMFSRFREAAAPLGGIVKVLGGCGSLKVMARGLGAWAIGLGEHALEASFLRLYFNEI